MSPDSRGRSTCIFRLFNGSLSLSILLSLGLLAFLLLLFLGLSTALLLSLTLLFLHGSPLALHFLLRLAFPLGLTLLLFDISTTTIRGAEKYSYLFLTLSGQLQSLWFPSRRHRALQVLERRLGL